MKKWQNLENWNFTKPIKWDFNSFLYLSEIKVKMICRKTFYLDESMETIFFIHFNY